MRYNEIVIEADRFPQRPDITKSPVFKSWFAGSKVVDRRKRPLVVYHGTYSDFDVFAHEEYNNGILAFFTTAPEYASGYASSISNKAGSVMPVYLRIVKPFDYRNQPELTAERFWRTTGGIHDPIARWQIRIALYNDPEIEDDDNPDIHNEELSFEEFADALKEGYYPAFEAPEFVKWLIGSGYDGLVMQEGGGTTYAIFEPNQVKSAISNATFDKNSSKITERKIASLSGEIRET